MNFQPILFVVGLLSLALGVLMIGPAVLDFINNEPTWEAFAESAFLTLLFSALCIFANRPSGRMELSVRETFILTTGSWVVLSLFASLPFILTTVTTSYTDSFFEAISALTTTGSTVITNLDYAPESLLLWRALLQWVGGIGIIVMAMTVLPLLRIGGMQLFHSEFSDRSEKILPRVSQITKAIFWTYCGLTLLCALLLLLTGIGLFDALCHAMTCVSTGGMANYDNSIAHFNSPVIEFILMVFMILGAIPLIQQIRFLRGNYGAFWSDDQTKTFLALVIIVPFLMSLWRWWQTKLTWLQALQETTFNFVSVMSITGYNTANYAEWGAFSVIALFAFLFIGGCTGSTAGGFKMFRLKVVYSLSMAQLYKLYRPHSVRVPTYNNQEITFSVFSSVVTFLTLFFTAFGILASALALTGLDFLTSIAAAAAIITNLGPGFGDIIGPHGSYAYIPDSAKWILMFGMLLGRLELITVLILFLPSFWRK